MRSVEDEKLFIVCEYRVVKTEKNEAKVPTDKTGQEWADSVKPFSKLEVLLIVLRMDLVIFCCL